MAFEREGRVRLDDQRLDIRVVLNKICSLNPLFIAVIVGRVRKERRKAGRFDVREVRCAGDLRPTGLRERCARR